MMTRTVLECVGTVQSPNRTWKRPGSKERTKHKSVLWVGAGTHFARAPDPNVVWPIVVEKAYAKLHGCYEAIVTGCVSTHEYRFRILRSVS